MNSNNSTWLIATVVRTFDVAVNVKGLVFDVPGWQGYSAGQHVDVRLTSADGYVAERSYSIANAPQEGSNIVELGVELMPDGEVSPYLWQLKVGDKIELRGPVGGHFVWDTSMTGPLVLIAGGSGMVPLMSMLRLAVLSGTAHDRDIVFIISLRTLDRLLYATEIESIRAKYPRIKVVITLTENAPTGWSGYSRRIDIDMFKGELGGLMVNSVSVYVCGPTKFVEAAAGILIDTGFPAEAIKTERFGG